MKEKEEDFYVGIQDPIALRKGMLEGSKGLVGLLQRFEAITPLRLRKQAQMEELRASLRGLQTDIGKIKLLMPKVRASTLPKSEKPKAASLQAPKPKPIPPKVANLARDLDEIERRLSELQ